MKKLIPFVIALSFFISAKSLAVNKSNFVTAPEVDRTLTVNLSIPSGTVLDFVTDPLNFLYDKIDIESYLRNNKDANQFIFVIVSDLGTGRAVFNRKGKLVRTRLNFENILAPRDVRLEVFEDYPGWIVKKVKFKAWGKKDAMTKNIYKFTLERDGEKKEVKYIR
ncbi:hypothetical protein [Gramella sp. KN1008]|uniref:hypothetical protein n=1 Tax=Gramella sp. KN1008 TaxID=2529298 RepID=UPI00103E14C5|nr:hypothetical protein [Gramella sp. KN1008]TBW30416.1 hypothetical protein EZJ28_03145 [Gramella sp. KN1008]